MNSNEYLFRTIYEILNHKSSLVLASIIRQQGSSPRHIGAKMIVDGNGKIYGTIGGSLLEASVTKESRKVFISEQSRLMDFDLTNQNVYSGEMICGGKATVLLDYITATQENLNLFQSSYNRITHGEEFSILTFCGNTDCTVIVFARCLLVAGGQIIGECPLSEPDLGSFMNSVLNTRETTSLLLKDLRVLVDPIHKTKTLYCFGAGHVAKPTVQIAALVGFRVVVVDDRAEFSNMERFPDAWDVRIINAYAYAFNNLDVDSDTYIIIFTRGHQYDREVLEQAIKTNASYIGMIASQKKRDSIYEALKAKGITEEELERVHSPIGLKIGAETPEEISISIVAELIKYRSGFSK